jgi:peroxiredoxin Q/BCP
LQAKGAQVVAISTDSSGELARFKASLGAPFPFLSDPDGKISARFAGVSGGRSNRATVILDGHGNIVKVSEGLDALLPDSDIGACPSGGSI